MQKTLEEVSRNRTVLIIAHRLTTVQNADIIVVLNKGEIVEVRFIFYFLQLYLPYFRGTG